MTTNLVNKALFTAVSATAKLATSTNVDKATFRILNKDDPSQIIKEFPVMINPSAINLSTGKKLAVAKGTGSTGGATETQTDENGVKKNIVADQTESIETRISMELIYDLVDKYDLAKQKNGNVSGVISGGKSFIKSVVGGNLNIGQNLAGGLDTAVETYSKVHLLNEDFNYLSMAKACQNQNPVIFIWGPMIYTGCIETMDSTFSYFSSSGAPLRAKVKLTMISAQVPNKDKFKEKKFPPNILTGLFSGKQARDGNM